MAVKEKDKSIKNNAVEKKNKKEVKSTNKKDSKKKQSLWVRFRIFCHGVKSETSRVHWPSKKEMVKYSIATIVFIVFCSLFFYLIEVIFALIQSLVK
ncbi:putative preprotein translocase SecE [Mycoplasma sp. CAG:877]|nr:putative preprotein translocase SecE [Mycoplasma sp. CAG:877]